jgi:hypothetical protein
MKKLALGCGIVLVLLAAAGAAVGYYVYRQVSSTVAQFAELGQIPQIERGVRNRSVFAPPASGELTKSQVERLLQVQSAVRERLGARVAELEKRHKQLIEKEQANALDIPEIIAVYRGLAATWVDAKRKQVEALNDAGFSLEEYRWVRARAYAALGVPFLEIDVSQLVDDVMSGRTGSDPAEMRGAFGPEGPAANSSLVAVFKKQLEENLPLASLGL